MPLTTEEFFAVFRAYNLAVWPAQPILLALALTAVFLATRRPPGNGEGVYLILAALWLWGGLVYHVGFFREVNPAAWGFGALFVAEGGLFAWKAFRGPGSFRARRDLRGFAGGALILYALLVYPLLGWWAGHGYPDGPSFGAPCPTTIFTFGILLWSEARVPRLLLAVPVAWTVLGSWAAIAFGVPEDFGLPVAALVTLWLVSRPAGTPPRPSRTTSSS